MMISFKLDLLGHDVGRDISRIALVVGSDAVLQTVKTRLLLHYEEWFLDLDAGIPYYTEILAHNPDYQNVEAILARAISSSPGVKELKNISLSTTPIDRRVGVDFSYTDIYGKTINGSI